MWHAPPWILFLHEGKPHSILPAMRIGEVADVRHLSRYEADTVVRAAENFGGILRAYKVDLGSNPYVDALEARVAELEVACKEVHAAWMGCDAIGMSAALLEPMHRLEHVLAFGSALEPGGTDPKGGTT